MKQSLLKRLIKVLTKRKQTISTAESCTGGTISKLITSKAGSSRVFKGGIVSYSIESKIKTLGLEKEKLAKFSDVSEYATFVMVKNVKKIFDTNWAISSTGMSGLNGNDKKKPSGTLLIGIITPKSNFYLKKIKLKSSTRDANIDQASKRSILILLRLLKNRIVK